MTWVWSSSTRNSALASRIRSTSSGCATRGRAHPTARLSRDDLLGATGCADISNIIPHRPRNGCQLSRQRTLRPEKVSEAVIRELDRAGKCSLCTTACSPSPRCITTCESGPGIQHRDRETGRGRGNSWRCVCTPSPQSVDFLLCHLHYCNVHGLSPMPYADFRPADTFGLAQLCQLSAG
jgi:hypothetical protein